MTSGAVIVMTSSRARTFESFTAVPRQAVKGCPPIAGDRYDELRPAGLRSPPREPPRAGAGPLRVGSIARADSEAVRGPVVDVELGGHAGLLEREVKDHAVLRRADDVV